MRSRLEAAEKEKAELQRRLAQLTTASSPQPHHPFQADAHRQLETLHRQLSFKDQEVQRAAFLRSKRNHPLPAQASLGSRA